MAREIWAIKPLLTACMGIRINVRVFSISQLRHYLVQGRKYLRFGHPIHVAVVHVLKVVNKPSFTRFENLTTASNRLFRWAEVAGLFPEFFGSSPLDGRHQRSQ